MVRCLDASSREQADAPAPVSGKYERFPVRTKGSVPLWPERRQETKCRLEIIPAAAAPRRGPRFRAVLPLLFWAPPIALGLQGPPDQNSWQNLPAQTRVRWLFCRTV
jgi:hypothetical protein